MYNPVGFRISFQPVKSSKAYRFRNTPCGVKSVSWELFNNVGIFLPVSALVNSSLCPRLLQVSRHPLAAPSVWLRPHGFFLVSCTCLCRIREAAMAVWGSVAQAGRRQIHTDIIGLYDPDALQCKVHMCCIEEQHNVSGGIGYVLSGTIWLASKSWWMIKSPWFVFCAFRFAYQPYSVEHDSHGSRAGHFLDSGHARETLNLDLRFMKERHVFFEGIKSSVHFVYLLECSLYLSTWYSKCVGEVLTKVLTKGGGAAAGDDSTGFCHLHRRRAAET